MSKVIALVTGGASGLGRATAARLARQGASLVIADLPTSRGEEVAMEMGGNTTFVPTDVGDDVILETITHLNLLPLPLFNPPPLTFHSSSSTPLIFLFIGVCLSLAMTVECS